MTTTKTKTMPSGKLRRALLPACVLVSFLCVGMGTASAQDDFGNIVHHIESRYHVHRNYPFLMALAGAAVKAWQGTGVKDLKIAIFEDQHLLQTATDRELDQLMQEAGNSRWQPMVKSFDRRCGQHSYIYAKSEGRDLKLLIVNVEPSEAQVVQVRVDPSKLDEFLNEHTSHGPRKSADMAFN
ncbi:MAG TPA: hypothetical protein VI488_00755 [Candidatus Angelobacter sp.]